METRTFIEYEKFTINQVELELSFLKLFKLFLLIDQRTETMFKNNLSIYFLNKFRIVSIIWRTDTNKIGEIYSRVDFEYQDDKVYGANIKEWWWYLVEGTIKTRETFFNNLTSEVLNEEKT